VGFPSLGAAHPASPLAAVAAAGNSSASSSPRSHASAGGTFGGPPAARSRSSGPPGGGSRPVGDAGALSAGEAGELLLDCVAEFNACVPYSGLTTDAEVDPLALAALLALLPEGIQVGQAGGGR
jgi:hypothetical protein